MRDLFDLPGVAGMPWLPMTLWQESWHNIARWQRLWLSALQPGALAGEGLPAPASMLAGLMPILPRIEANIVPLPKEGALAAADDAARLTMRIVLPGFAGFGAGEVLLVDAVVARATGEAAARLGGARPAPELAGGEAES